MRIQRLFATVTLACALLAAVPSSGATTTQQNHSFTPIKVCPHLYTREDFHRAARKAFDGKRRSTRHERRTLSRVLRCQRHAKSRPLLLDHRKRYRHGHLLKLRVVLEWAHYRSHPMPYCTWGPESGGDYRARNSVSTAGGKYQILDSTWAAFGGHNHASRWDASYAPRLEQERIARRIAYLGWSIHPPQGLSAWVNC